MENLQIKNKTERELAKTLAEAIMLKAIEDIWHTKTKKESMDFFSGAGFGDCADIIGMTLYERHKFLEFVLLDYRSTIRVSRVNPSPFKVAYHFLPHHQN